MRLFHSQRIATLFPAGVVVCFIGGVLAAPALFGPAMPAVLIGGIALGLAASAALYLWLRLVPDARIRARREARLRARESARAGLARQPSGQRSDAYGEGDREAAL